MSSTSVRVRFAPSPTGALHVGNVRTALFNWLWARQQSGRFILRIEDTDQERSRPEYEQQIYEDLRWLGLDWDEGPDVGGDYGPYRQSQRLALYHHYASRLLQAGLAYYCFCTPEELAAERKESGPSLREDGEEDGEGLQEYGEEFSLSAIGRWPSSPRRYLYSGKCRALSAEQVEARRQQGQPFTIRFKVRSGLVGWEDWVRGPIQWQAELLGDFVIIKSDGWPVYNFAVVVDDIEMNITDVIRGDGHLPNTPRQLLIYEALGVRPPRFGHLSTIVGPDGTKLSKRHGATAVAEFRQQGYLPEALFNFLALLGWQPESVRAEEAKARRDQAEKRRGREEKSPASLPSRSPSSPPHPEVLSPEQLIAQFSMDRVGKAPAMFDVEKLKWLNRYYLRQANVDRLVELSIPYLQRAGRLPQAPLDEPTREWLKLVLEMVAPRLDHLSQIVEETDVIFDYDLSSRSEAEEPKPTMRDEVREVLEDPASVQVIRALQEALSPLSQVTLDAFQSAMSAVERKTGRSGRALFHPVRVALTGRGSGPALVKLVPIYERGSQLPLPQPVLSVVQRLEVFLKQATRPESIS